MGATCSGIEFPITVELASGQLEAIEDVSVVAGSVTFLGEKDLLCIKAEETYQSFY